MKKLSYIFLSILLSTAFLGGTAFTLVNGIDTTYDPYILIYRSNPGNKYVAKYIKKDVTPSAPPIVNAGADTTLPIGQDSVELLGSAFSDAGIQSYSWTQISGSTSDIISPSSAHTLIKNFSGDGNYVYRLTATDINGLTGYDDITVKISSANIVLTMPEDQELKHDSSWSFLQATASYSGGSITNYQWTQVSGHNVTINTPDKDSTSIYGYLTTIDTSNYYKFKLVVTSSGDTKDSGYVTVMVDSTTLKPGEYFVNSSRSVTFNFTPFAQNIEGYVDVIGDPSKSVVTATASNGISVSSIGTDSTLWNSSPLLDNKSAGVIGMTYTTPSDPYGYQEFDSSALTTGWINWNSQYVPGTYNLRISGLDPNSIYQLQMIGSITYTDSTSANQYSTRTDYRTNTGQSFSLNTQFRTSKAIVEDTVHANANGQIYLSVAGQDTTYSNGSSGVLSALRIYHISRDSVTGTQRTALYKTYYDTVYINDGGVNRLCIVYLPYNYNPSQSYPLMVYMDGQEDAVKDYNWDPQVLTGDGIGIVAEHNEGKMYGLRANGDTASFFILFPQTSLNEWSLTPIQIHNLITNFKSRFSGTYDINDSTFIAGFSSGGIGTVNYLYNYPSEVTAAFIQSPAPDGTYQMPTPATLRDTSAKFDEYGIHVWLVTRQDGFGDEIDSVKKYIDLANPYNEYYRYWGRDHSGFAWEYELNPIDPIYKQSIYDFFFNPTQNGSKAGFFAFKNDGNGITSLYTNVLGNPSYQQPSQGVLTGTNDLGWSVTTGSTSKFSGTTFRGQGAGAASVNVIRILPFYTNTYILGNGSIMNAKTGGYATNGYNMTVAGLKADSTYELYFSGSGAQDGNYHATFTVNGNSVNQDQTQLRETLYPVELDGIADGSGDIQFAFYPQNSGDTAILSYLIIKEKYSTALPYVNAGVDQTIQLPTSSTSLSGTAYAFSGSITSTTWSVVSSPSGITPTISDASDLNTTISGLTGAGDYEIELSATDGVYTVKDTMNITVNSAPPPSGDGFVLGDRMLIDLGGSTDQAGSSVGASNTTSPQPDGRYWNTLGAPIYKDGGGAIRNASYTTLVDTAGNTIEGASLTSGGNPYGYYATDGVGGVNAAGGNSSSVGDYPASATVDSWITQNTTTQDDAQILLKLPAGTYSIKFWGARATSGTLTSNVTYDGTTLSYNASNNSSYTNAAVFDTVVSDGSSNIVFDINSSGSTNGFSYWGVMDIKRIPTASVLFNFNKTAQSVSGTVDVSGSPQGSVISVTDPTTGWGINSVATSAWPAFGPFSSANDNGGDTDDGGGFVFGTDVTRSSWYSQGKDTTSGPTRRLQITGLDDTKTYTLSFLSSIDPTIGAPNGQTVWYHINEVAGTFKQSVVVDNNTSNLVKYSGLVPSSGVINIDMNNTSTSVFVIVNGLKIEQE